MPPRGKKGAGLDGALDLSGLTDALGGLVGGLVGGLGKTLTGVTETVGQTVGGLLSGLLSPLQQLKQQAEGGSQEAGEAYNQAVSMLRRSADKGRTDAEALLRELGEALGESPDEPNREKPQA